MVVGLPFELLIPTILKGLVSAEKFDKGGFNMELVKGRIMISKGKMYVRMVKSYAGMYRIFLNDEGSASR